MSVKRWGDLGYWTAPSQNHFLSSPSAFIGCGWSPDLASNSTVLQVNYWKKAFSTAVSQSPRGWAPEAWRQPPKNAHPLWNTTNGGPGQELGNELKNRWQVSRLQTQFWWAIMRLLRLWSWGCTDTDWFWLSICLEKPLPGPRALWESKEETIMERKSLA